MGWVQFLQITMLLVTQMLGRAEYRNQTTINASMMMLPLDVRRLNEEASHHNPNVNMHLLVTKIGEALEDPPVVDRDIKEMTKAYHRGNLCPFKRSVAMKMLRKETIEVVIVGGSVTYGADLGDRMKERWSNKFTEIITSGWYSGTINVQNIGVGACNLDVWIDKVNEVRDADMVIIDLSVNDQGFDLQGLPLLYQTFLQLVDDMPRHPAILVHYAFRTGKDNRAEYGHCPDVRDQGMCCNGYLWCRRWWDMQDFAAVTFNKFKIPFISFRDLVWPEYDNPPDALPQIWNGLSHPDKRAHALFAKLISFAFMMQLKESHTVPMEECGLGEGQANNITKSRYITGEDINPAIKPLCYEPLTYKMATDDRTSERIFVPYPPSTDETVDSNYNSSWNFYNDSKLKYGWILETNKKDVEDLCKGVGADNEQWCERAEQYTTISFEIETSDEYVIQIAYLKSYPEFYGRARVWVDDRRDHSVVLSGRWEEDGRVLPYSVTRIATIFSSDEALTKSNRIMSGETHVLVKKEDPWRKDTDFASGQASSMSNSEADGGLKLSPGKHTLHISGTRFGSDKYKWKLLGITTC